MSICHFLVVFVNIQKKEYSLFIHFFYDCRCCKYSKGASYVFVFVKKKESKCILIVITVLFDIAYYLYTIEWLYGLLFMAQGRS
jgi:hypothetical protein